MGYSYVYSSPETVRTTVKEWVSIEKTISAEAAEWSEKRMLLDELLNLANIEIETLQSSIAEIESTQTAADTDRKKLLAAQDVLNENHTIIRRFLESIEPKLQAIKARLPSPLVEQLEPFYRKLPDNSKETTLGIAQRMQTTVGILTTIQTFDSTISINDEIRDFENGVQGEVRTVYIGLSSAYYYAPAGDDAGIGYPSAASWIWESQPSLHSDIAEVIAIAEQSASEARFITLPVSLKD